KLVVRLSDREIALHAELAEAATDPGKLVELDAELKKVLADKDVAEERWMELAAELD
ncbi:MAG: hypothetical protein ABW364_23225, partial [Rhodococcus fascians]